MNYYDPKDWYWDVKEDDLQGLVYSSRREAFVAVSDETFLQWRATGNYPTPIATRAELDAVLIAAGLASSSPLSMPLTPRQFHAMVENMGLTDALFDAIKAMPQPQRGIAYGAVYYASSYDRNDPMFVLLGPVLGMTPEQIDAAWLQALEIGV